MNRKPALRADAAAGKPSAELFVVDVLKIDGQVIVSPHGELDIATAPLLWDRLAALIPDVKGRLVVDLSETTFVDSTGLAVFVRVFKQLRDEDGAELVLRSPSRSTKHVLNITGLDGLLTIE